MFSRWSRIFQLLVQSNLLSFLCAAGWGNPTPLGDHCSLSCPWTCIKTWHRRACGVKVEKTRGSRTLESWCLRIDFRSAFKIELLETGTWWSVPSAGSSAPIQSTCLSPACICCPVSMARAIQISLCQFFGPQSHLQAAEIPLPSLFSGFHWPSQCICQHSALELPSRVPGS